MQFKKEIEQSLEQILILEEHFRHAKNSEILPISFFSASYDIVRELAGTLHHIEQEQLKFMQEQFIANDISFLDTTNSSIKTKTLDIFEEQLKDSFFPEDSNVFKESKDPKDFNDPNVLEVPNIPKEEEKKILADTIKYTSLNDKFSNRFSQ